MSFTISTSDIKEAYEKRKQFESLADATIEFLNGCVAYQKESNGSVAQKGAILQIFGGIFAIANEMIPGECGGWTISVGQNILEWFCDGVLYDVLANNIEQKLSMELAEDVMNLEKEAALEAWQSLSEDELKATIDNMLGIYEDVTTDDSEKYDWYHCWLLGIDMIKDFFSSSSAEKLNGAHASVLKAKRDPLVIDLNGDGFNTLSVEDGVYFNLDGEGLTEKTAWVNGADDALLARDLNGNGVIDDGTELFTDNTILANGTTAANGFEALIELDENGDGVIDNNDSAYAELFVWQDVNNNGLTDEGELKTLMEVGISQISVVVQADGTEFENGNVLEQAASVTFTDGSTSQIGQFSFDTQPYNTVDTEDIEIPEEIAVLPTVSNIGNIRDLHVLMTLDEDGSIRSSIETFQSLTDHAEKVTVISNMLYDIASDRVSNIPTGWSDLIDVRKLAVIESVTGTETDGFISTHAAEVFEEIFDDIVEIYVNQLNFQTSLAEYVDYFQAIYIDVEGLCKHLAQSDAFSTQLGDIVRYLIYLDNDMSAAALQSVYNHFAEDSDAYAAIMAEASGNVVYTDENDNITGTENNELIFGGAGSDVLTGGYGNDVLSGGVGNDTLYGVAGANVLLGMDGDDTINGGAGDDIINGGTGNDVLSGDAGNDIYYFDAGCGIDRITDISGNNRIVIGAGLHYEDMSVSYENDALVLRFADSSDQLVIEGFTRHEIFRNFTIIFEYDNTELECSDVTQTIFNTFNGTENADSLYPLFGISANLRGHGGDDTLSGSDDNDILDGGSGIDVLNGGNGTDTYIFAKGYSNDTVNEWGSDITVIKLTDINSDEVTLNSQSENNLVISVNGTSDTLTISNYRWSHGSFTLEFANGAVAAVNKETWEMEYSQYPTVTTEETVAEVSEDEMAQTNAELLSELYTEDTLSDELISETDNTIISDVTNSTTIADETDEVADQTDLQVMILTENMSAFADEDTVSDGINITDASANESVMNQLLVNSTV